MLVGKAHYHILVIINYEQSIQGYANRSFIRWCSCRGLDNKKKLEYITYLHKLTRCISCSMLYKINETPASTETLTTENSVTKTSDTEIDLSSNFGDF